MRRILLAWLLTLPLIAVGSQLAHNGGYRLAEPTGETRESALTATGHGYLDALPLLITLSVVLVAAILLATLSDSFHGRRGLHLQLWPFAIVPFIGFLTQEVIERAIAGVAVSPATLIEAPILLGLLLQAPFAAAAYAIGGALVRVAHDLGRALAPPPVTSEHVAPPVFRAQVLVATPAASRYLNCWAGRGPPAPSLFALS